MSWSLSMPSGAELGLLVFLGLGAYVQALAGFAMAMLAVALAAALTPLPLTLITAVTMVAAFVNVVGGLHGAARHVDRAAWLTMSLVQVPAVVAGLWLLSLLSGAASTWLRAGLGAFVLATGLAMLLRPQPQVRRSIKLAFALVGGSGGLLNGLFAAGGPIAGWFLYRQPMAAAQVRATLLAFFMVGSGVRIVSVAATGGFAPEVLRLAAYALPVTLLCTWLGRAYAPPLGEQATRRFAFGLLIVCGLLILHGAFIDGFVESPA